MPPLSQIHLPRAILFDHDGVLVRSEPLHWKAWRELLRELGLPYVEAEIQTMVGYKPVWVDESIQKLWDDLRRLVTG